jgi:hypothetical protein
LSDECFVSMHCVYSVHVDNRFMFGRSVKMSSVIRWTYLILGHKIILMLYAESILLLLSQGGITQGIPSTATICDLLCVPIRVLIIPDSSSRVLWK